MKDTRDGCNEVRDCSFCRILNIEDECEIEIPNHIPKDQTVRYLKKLIKEKKNAHT